MNRFAAGYSYSMDHAMHCANVYGFNCVCKYTDCQDE